MKSIRLFAFIIWFIALTASAAQPAAHTKGTPTGHPAGSLKPGEYWWNPAASPNGPVVVLVSLPMQTMNVYRNGILVGRTSVSTGTKGHSTPTGVFTILEKKETHYSNLYQNAPMPNMQRSHMGRHCDAFGKPAWLSRQPWLHPHALRFLEASLLHHLARLHGCHWR